MRNNTSADAVARLRTDYGVKAGGTIYTTVKHVSRSGMSRTIAAYVSHKGEIHDVSHLVAAAIGARFDRDRGGVILSGCGMDMTFHLVYSLSRAMWPAGHKCNGIAAGRHRCPSNDHSNDYGQAARIARDELETEGVDRDDFGAYRDRVDVVMAREGLTYRKGRRHSDGGYALNRASL